MEKLLVVIGLGWMGLLLGSFVGAQVWRLRAKQLVEDKRAGESYDKAELKKLSPLLKSVRQDRSQCLHCQHTLAWYDLLPVISWVSLGGRCRYCRKLIGWLEPALEVGLAGIFVVSYLLWPFSLATFTGLALFTLWLMSLVIMAILFVYDAKWSLLPFAINIMLIVTAVAFRLLIVAEQGFVVEDAISLVLALGIMSGLYYVFSLFGWVGLGDSILGIGLALLLGRWELAFLALFLANLAGSLMLIPMYLRNTLRRNMHVPFGPFMILGTVIAVVFGHNIIEWAFSSSDVLINTFML